MTILNEKELKKMQPTRKELNLVYKHPNGFNYTVRYPNGYPCVSLSKQVAEHFSGCNLNLTEVKEITGRKYFIFESGTNWVCPEKTKKK